MSFFSLNVLEFFYLNFFSYLNVLALLVGFNWDLDSYIIVLYHHFNFLKFVLYQLIFSRFEYL